MKTASSICAVVAVVVLLGMAPTSSRADIVFTFTESGGDVIMTPSGTIETANLVADSSAGWGSTGLFQDGVIHLMGGTDVGGTDTGFAFSAGTDYTAWFTGNPWDLADFFFFFTPTAGSKGFSTYTSDAGTLVPGLQVLGSQLDGTLWTPDQVWEATAETFASIGMNPGTYSVSDAVTGETITIQIGPPSGPANDTCENKVEVTCDSVTAGTITGATGDDPDCFSSGTDPSVWYSINVPFNANVTASFCKPGASFDFDTILDIYDGGCDALSCVTFNDDTCGLGSEATWAANAGERYEIRVSGFTGAEGDFDLAVNCDPTCDGVELDAPEKVTVGVPFDLNVSCANADVRILVACGRNDAGSTRFVPGCGVVDFGVGPRANNFGTTMADGDGNATRTLTLGDSFGNNTLYCQVLDASKCETSNVVAIDVNKGK